MSVSSTQLEETEQLLSKHGVHEQLLEKNSPSPETTPNLWHWYHTATVLSIRLIIDFTFKNPLVFYLNYQQGLNISYLEYAYILVAAEIGAILALFLGPLNKHYLHTEQNIMILYLSIIGVVTILFPLLSYLGIMQDNDIFIVIWCCIMRFIFGMSFSFISAASIKFASQYVSDPNKITSIIAILHYSWPLSTAINIIAGYIIIWSTDGWMWVFVGSGIVSIIISIGAHLLFNWHPLEPSVDAVVEEIAQEEEDAEEARRHQDDTGKSLKMLMTDLNSVLILIVSIFMSFRSKTIYVVTSSLWLEETFDLSASYVGWSTVSVIIGEVLALGIMTTLSHKLHLWQCAAGALLHQLVFGALLFILSSIYGNDITLEAALVFTAALTMGHELFYVVQQSNAIHYAPLPRLKFLLLLGERTAQESASIIALILTVPLWNFWGNNAILIYSIIWIATTLIEGLILIIYQPQTGALKKEEFVIEDV